MTFIIKGKGVDKDRLALEEEYQDKIKQIAKSFKNKGTFITKKQMLKDLFNWWNKNIKYDYAILNNPRTNNGTGKYPGIVYDYKNTHILASEKYAPILLKKGICASFASAFKDICELIGVRCRVVTSEDEAVIPTYKKFSHAWNEVYIDGEYRTIDLTPSFVTFLGELRTNKFTIHDVNI